MVRPPSTLVTTQHCLAALDFGPYVGAGQDPGTPIPSAQIASLQRGLRGSTRWIRTSAASYS
jgi:hypothetical protein